MARAQKAAAVVFAALLAASVYGYYRTSQPFAVPQARTGSANALSQTAVDQTPLTTARKLAQMPTSAEEQAFAVEALRISDHDMDLAFAQAERELENHPPALTAEAKAIQARLNEAEDALDRDNALVERLTADESKATGAKKDALDEQLVLAKAHQEEDQDEVDDAKEDLIRAGGDPKSRIEEMIEQHKTSSEASDNLHITVAPDTEDRGLLHFLNQWAALHQKQLLLWSAKQQAESVAALLSAKHNTLEAQVDSAKANASPAGDAGAQNQQAAGGTDAAASDTTSQLNKAKKRSTNRKILSGFDQRIDDQKQLADNYAKWIAAVAAKQRVVVHRALTGVIIIFALLLIGLFFDGWLEKLLGRTALDRRQVETLRTVTRVSLQVVAVLFILLVIFGPPGQLGTFLGLAGAGLTVALKDFIVGFIGWLVLMGKNGIRLGDWVEINGVTGEVVELGMFHTVLLETGNWTDTGHPTGRRVTFTNSFAIEGHYFNFSTSGQWLWDELQLVLPSGKDPYPIVDAIRKKVGEATAQSAQQAEQEWKAAARSRDMSVLSAAPAINVKPVAGGVEVSVRYVTRANERYQLRAKLYQEAVDLLGQVQPA